MHKGSTEDEKQVGNQAQVKVIKQRRPQPEKQARMKE